VLSAFAILLSNELIRAYFAACRPQSECVLMPLSDLIHQVPGLLQVMPSECLAALIATSTNHRSQIHNHVTSITICDPTHADDLISCSCTWPRLVKWTLADQDSHRILIRVTCDMTVAAASVLAKANILSRWHLQLEGIELSASVAAEIAKGDWLCLVGLFFGRAKLTRAVVQELVTTNWPALTCLSTLELPVDMGLLSLLSQARWPQLTFLNLLSVELPSTQQGKELELQILSALRSAWVLQADTEQTSSSSSASIATLNWSSIIALSLLYQQVDTQVVTKLLHTGVNQIEVVVFDHVQLDAAVILQLTKSECPRLQTLSLRYSGIGSVAISYLAQGKWPLLEKMFLKATCSTMKL